MPRIHRSNPIASLYRKLEEHLEKRGYSKPWERYEIITDINVEDKQNIPYLFLGLHEGIEPVFDLIKLLHEKIFGSRIFVIKYNDVKLEDRLKSHETTEVPFLREKMAEIVVSIHTMPDDWLEKKIAIGGLPKESNFKKILAEKLKKTIFLDVIIADKKNGFREFIVQGQKDTNPVNYAAIREGIQIEFPYYLLNTKSYNENIANAIISSIYRCSFL